MAYGKILMETAQIRFDSESVSNMFYNYINYATENTFDRKIGKQFYLN